MGLIGASPALAGGPVPVADAAYSGFTSGDAIHLGAVNNGTTTLAELDQAYAGAAVNTAGLASQVVSEVNTVIQGAAADKNAGGRGSGIEVGLGQTTPIANNQIILAGLATATAPPSTGLIDKSVGPIDVTGVVHARLLQGQAQATYNPGACNLGRDIGYGFGHLADATAVGTGPTATVNAPGESSSTSHMVMVPQTDKSGAVIGSGTGLMAETKQTVAPVGLLGGAVTITVVGPLSLRAVATGVPGGAYVDYTPPSLVTIQAGTTTIANITAAQLLGANGVNVTIPGIATITIGTPPRQLGGTGAPAAAADGTSASGAYDLIHVGLALGSLSIADLRVGHMEVSATVPPGGIKCQIDVAKTAQPSQVNPGDKFTYTITVHNPHACVLTDVKVVDTITATPGVHFTILGQNPPANSNIGGVLTWNDIGPINPDETKTLTVDMQVSRSSGGGTFTEKADVTANCAINSAQGGTKINVPASGTATIHLPTISGGAGRALPVTGGLTGRYYAVALVIGLAALAAGRRGLKAFFTKA